VGRFHRVFQLLPLETNCVNYDTILFNLDCKYIEVRCIFSDQRHVRVRLHMKPETLPTRPDFTEHLSYGILNKK